MRVSLQVRVLLLVAAINVVVFGAGAVWLSVKLSEERGRLTGDLSELLAYALEPTISSRGEIKVAQLLRWPSWEQFEDAIIVADTFEPSTDGRLVPRGAHLNPVGRSRRSATFDEQAVLREIVASIEGGEPRSGAGGVAFPIVDGAGRTWGGCWFALARAAGTRELFSRLTPWFVLSTLLLTLGTFSLLRRFVLDPVRDLAAGSRRVSEGDLSVRLAEPRRRDELSDLIRGFNSMTETVHRYNERLAHEVELATRQVRRAEAAAMTQRRLAATGELAAGVAHEINNPLGGLLNAVEALDRAELGPEKRRQYHDLLRAGLERIRVTVGQLLRFTPRATRTGPVRLIDPVLDAVALVAHRAREQGVEVRLCAAGDRGGARGGTERILLLGRGARSDEAERAARERAVERFASVVVSGEANELGQAVLNLLGNSLDALAERGAGGGRIDVTLGVVPGADGEEALLEVSDDGPGVAAAELERVADLFYTTKEVGKGSGLGLAIVHNVVSSHGGRVHLASDPGRGFTVELCLPLGRDPAGPGGSGERAGGGPSDPRSARP